MSVDTGGTYKSRRGGLIFFGLVELAMGVLCLLVVSGTAMSPILRTAQARPGMPVVPVSSMIMNIALYTLGGALLVSLGVGSMLCRRWARDLSLVVAWMWLILGVAMTAAVIFMVPRFMPAMPSDAAGTGTVILTCLAIFSGLFGILVPLSMILFYRSPHVRATCLALDPHPRWTERAPLPLLGLSLWLAVSAVCLTTMSTYAVLPLGTRIVTGPAAVIVYCAIGILVLYVSWGLFMRSLAAWWIGLAYGVVTAVYCVVVFPQLDYNALVKAMRMPMPETPGMPDFATICRSPWFLGWLAIFWLGYLGYFVFVRRYFPRAAEVVRG